MNQFVPASVELAPQTGGTAVSVHIARPAWVSWALGLGLLILWLGVIFQVL